MTSVVVVGDVLLDRDVRGRVERLSPEAPVPVVEEVEEHTRAGGAGLAAWLAAEDGTEVMLVTPLGDDEISDSLRALLSPRVRLVELPLIGRPAERTRVRADGHPIVRLDRSPSYAVGDPGPEVEAALAGAGAVLVSDYGRGVTGNSGMRALLARAATGTPLVWDPHPRGADPVRQAHLLCPNLAEALAGRGGENAGLAAVSRGALRLLRRHRARGVAVTLGERGALLCLPDGSPLMFPAETVAAADACGAGDRFAATAAGMLASGALVSEAVGAAVSAATCFVAAGGASGLHRSPPAATGPDPVAGVRARGGTVVATGGCFDVLHAGHVAMLRAARALGDCLVVCLNSDASVRRAKGPDRPVNPAADRAAVLAALGCVDSVRIFDEDTPAEILTRLRPDIWAKGGDYRIDELPEASVVASWGGQTVLLPYLAERSSTRVVTRTRT